MYLFPPRSVDARLYLYLYLMTVSVSSPCSEDVQGVSFSTASSVDAKGGYRIFLQPAVWTYPSTALQCGRGASPSTASSVDVKGGYLSTACCMDVSRIHRHQHPCSVNVQGVSLSTASNVDVQGVSLSPPAVWKCRVYSTSTISSMDVKGVSIFAGSRVNPS
jgi:hypothetical protein